MILQIDGKECNYYSRAVTARELNIKNLKVIKAWDE